jgi:hypothetical protein
VTAEIVIRELTKTETWLDGRIRHTWAGGGKATHDPKLSRSCDACAQEKARVERAAEIEGATE